MGLQDLVVTPIYLIIFYILALVVRPRVTNGSTRKYFLPGLTIKFVGAIGLGLIYQFYYQGGDTLNYWNNGGYVYEALKNNPLDALSWIVSGSEPPSLYSYYSYIWLRKSEASFFIVKSSGIIDLFTFHTYSATALFFAVYSFSGTWALFQLLLRKYPGNLKPLFAAFFLMPSTMIWCSGIMKDSIALSSLFWLVWGTIRILDYKRVDFKGIVVMIIASFLLLSVKVYILMCAFPCLLFYAFLKYHSSFKSIASKVLITPIIILVFGSLSLVGIRELGKEDKRYEVENIAQSSKITAYDLKYGWGSNAGSGYSLGEHQGTWIGMLSLAPQGIITAIYRPFLWEASNALMLIAALESSYIILLSIGVLFKGLRKRILSDPFLLFCLIFSFIFAFAVGVSTFNFGTLNRYRIPLIPFHLVALTITKKAFFSNGQSHKIDL